VLDKQGFRNRPRKERRIIANALDGEAAEVRGRAEVGKQQRSATYASVDLLQVGRNLIDSHASLARKGLSGGTGGVSGLQEQRL
jgi:hypothetical protein